MRRYWIDTKSKYGDQVNFQGEVHHHIFDVCRQEKGSKFEVLTEEGKAYLVEVTHTDRKSAQAQVIEERQIPPLKTPWIRLILAIPRFPVMDAVLEKAVELGVKSVQPVFSDFSFVRTPQALSGSKTERWQKIIKSGTQQTGRGELMELAETRKLEEILEEINRRTDVAGLFAYEGPSTLGIKEELTRLKHDPKKSPQEIWIFVGSEGGYSSREIGLFEKSGLKPVTLGPMVLRVETACMALISAVKYDFDLMC